LKSTLVVSEKKKNERQIILLSFAIGSYIQRIQTTAVLIKQLAPKTLATSSTPTA
jgi:hypothetical protein